MLLKFLEAMRGLNDEIVPELAWQMGRPVRYGGEFRTFEERLLAIVRNAPAALAPKPIEDSPSTKRFATREAAGVVLVIAPWNYPFVTALNTIAPALLSGNAVILKHAVQTLLAGDRFAQALHMAGLPDGLFAHVAMKHETTEELLAAGLFDHLTFTGSVAGGLAVQRAASSSFTTLTLELGGKDAAYVHVDADLPKAVAGLVDGSFYNSGQCCCGIERIYVARPVYQSFVDDFVSLTKTYVLGDPLDQASSLGPMATLRQAQIARDQTQAAIAQGARPLIATREFAADTHDTPYLAPQVLVDVDHGMSVMRDETFGPVAAIMPVSSEAEAIHLMNDSQYGLTASIWTRDFEFAERIGAEVAAGTVFMNRCDYVDPDLGWSGVRLTGKGASLGPQGYEGLTRPKGFHLRA